MPEIKTKEFVDAQEVFEGVTDLGDRMRRGLGRGGDYARNLADDGQVSSDEYAADQLQYATEDIGSEAGHIAVDTTRSARKNTRKAMGALTFVIVIPYQSIDISSYVYS